REVEYEDLIRGDEGEHAEFVEGRSDLGSSGRSECRDTPADRRSREEQTHHRAQRTRRDGPDWCPPLFLSPDLSREHTPQWRDEHPRPRSEHRPGSNRGLVLAVENRDLVSGEGCAGWADHV